VSRTLPAVAAGAFGDEEFQILVRATRLLQRRLAPAIRRINHFDEGKTRGEDEEDEYQVVPQKRIGGEFKAPLLGGAVEHLVVESHVTDGDDLDQGKGDAAGCEHERRQQEDEVNAEGLDADAQRLFKVDVNERHRVHQAHKRERQPFAGLFKPAPSQRTKRRNGRAGQEQVEQNPVFHSRQSEPDQPRDVDRNVHENQRVEAGEQTGLLSDDVGSVALGRVESLKAGCEQSTYQHTIGAKAEDSIGSQRNVADLPGSILILTRRSDDFRTSRRAVCRMGMAPPVNPGGASRRATRPRSADRPDARR
jgi:hypothetical protein